MIVAVDLDRPEGRSTRIFSGCFELQHDPETRTARVETTDLRHGRRDHFLSSVDAVRVLYDPTPRGPQGVA